MNLARVGLVAVILGSAQLVYAAPFGTVEDAKLCEKELTEHPDWKQAILTVSQAIKRGDVSAPCKAELEKQAKKCQSDPETQKYTNNPDNGLAHSDTPNWCLYSAFYEMRRQLESMIEQKETDRRAGRDPESLKAALEATEMPKAGMKNPALEKAVAAAYQKDYSGKILKVVLDRWDDDLEKDAFGKVTGRNLGANVVNKRPDGKCELHYELWLQHGSGKSFSGPLKARGAGSATDTEILCNKVK